MVVSFCCILESSYKNERSREFVSMTHAILSIEILLLLDPCQLSPPSRHKLQTNHETLFRFSTVFDNYPSSNSDLLKSKKKSRELVASRHIFSLLGTSMTPQHNIHYLFMLHLRIFFRKITTSVGDPDRSEDSGITIGVRNSDYFARKSDTSYRMRRH